MTKKERVASQEQFAKIVVAVHASLGGRAAINTLAEAVFEQVGGEMYRTRTWPGWLDQVRKAVTRHDATGLPPALSVCGEYVQRALFTAGDYREAIAAYCRRGQENLAVARLLAEEAYIRFAEQIDVDEVWIEAAAR
jgi:hypothetical protein